VGIAARLFPLLNATARIWPWPKSASGPPSSPRARRYLAVPLPAIELGTGLRNGTIDASASTSSSCFCRSGFSPKASPSHAIKADTRHHGHTHDQRLEENVMPTVRIAAATAIDHELSARRLNIMRCGYAFMGVGLAIVKWPVLVQNAPSLPVFEGVVACLLTAMSLLAFLGLRYPVRMLPILLFEVIWKVIWIAAVAVPHLIADDINTATRAVLVNCSLVVIIIAVIPWRYVWERYIQAPADAWR
jgi:hypothetical protein